jgi:hypothetical protein
MSDYNKTFTDLALKYAAIYKANGFNFINCFLKYKSIRSACAEIVKVMKDEGVYQDAEKTGKDFTGYAKKFNLNEKDEKTLAEILLIIYAIITETVSENTEGVC